jgi:hypothetical protein
MVNRMRNNHYGNAAFTSEKKGCGNEMAQLAISCYLDGEADAREQALAEWHLADCQECNMMLSQWGQNTGRLRQAAHTPEVDMLAGAIAGQTRQWLLNELLAPPLEPKTVALPRRRPAPTHRFKSLRGGFVAAIMAFITMLGVSLGALLSGPDFHPVPAVATIDRPVLRPTSSPVVLDNSPRTILVSATPVAPLPSLAIVSNGMLAQSQTAAPRPRLATPLLGGYTTPYTVVTPGVGGVVRDSKLGN